MDIMRLTHVTFGLYKNEVDVCYLSAPVSGHATCWEKHGTAVHNVLIIWTKLVEYNCKFFIS